MILELVAEQLVGLVGLRLEKYPWRVVAKDRGPLSGEICFGQKFQLSPLFRVREKQKGAKNFRTEGLKELTLAMPPSETVFKNGIHRLVLGDCAAS